MSEIPLALITSQYLAYLDMLESLQIEVATDFLLMAATLIQVKSGLLLPKEAEEEVAELIESLIAAQEEQPAVFNYTAKALSKRFILGKDVFTRQVPFQSVLNEESPELLIKSVTLWDLVSAFQRVKEREKQEPILTFTPETKTLEQRLEEVVAFCQKHHRSTFSELCASAGESGSEVTLSFLAILELARLKKLKLYQNLSQSPEIQISFKIS